MSVFEFIDYKAFIRDFIARQPQKGWGYIKKIADHLRMSAVQVSQVLTTNKNFTLEQTLHLTQFFSFNEIETEYFISLVEYERSGSEELRKFFKKKIEKAQKESLEVRRHVPEHTVLSDEDKMVFYSSWTYSAIRMFCSIGNGKTIEEIALKFKLDRLKVLSQVEFLIKNGLCVEENNRIKMGSQRTFLESTSPHFQRNLVNWRIKSIQSSEKMKPDELMYSSTVSLSLADFKSIRSQLLEQLKKISETITKSESQEVACLNIDWFFLD